MPPAVPTAAAPFFVAGGVGLLLGGAYWRIARACHADALGSRYAALAVSLALGLVAMGMHLAAVPAPAWAIDLLYLRLGRTLIGGVVLVLALGFVGKLAEARDGRAPWGVRAWILALLLVIPVGFTPWSRPSGGLLSADPSTAPPELSPGNLVLASVGMGAALYAVARFFWTLRGRWRAHLEFVPLGLGLALGPGVVALTVLRARGLVPWHLPIEIYGAGMVVAGGAFVPLRYAARSRALRAERRHAEGQARLLAQAIRDEEALAGTLGAVVEGVELGVLVTNGRGEVVLCNRLLERRLGWRPEKRPPPLPDPLPPVLALPDVEGLESRWEARASALATPGEGLVTLREVTGAEALDRLLAEIDTRAAAARLAAGVAHEVNNPLTAVSSVLQFMLEERLEEAARAHVRAAYRAVERMAQALRELLGLYRLEGRQSAPVDLVELLRSTLALTRFHPAVARARPALDAPAGLPAALAPRQDVQHAVVALLLFVAAHARAAGGNDPGLQIGVTREGAQLRVAFRVTSDLAPAHLARLLDTHAFVREPTAGAERSLTLARALLEQAGGELRASGGEGALCLELGLPVAP